MGLLRELGHTRFYTLLHTKASCWLDHQPSIHITWQAFTTPHDNDNYVMRLLHIHHKNAEVKITPPNTINLSIASLLSATLKIELLSPKMLAMSNTFRCAFCNKKQSRSGETHGITDEDTRGGCEDKAYLGP